MKKNKKTVKKLGQSFWSWPIKIFLLAFALSLFFGITSEFLLSGAGVIVSILLILILIAVAVITDMIGVAVTACKVEPFTAMAARKVSGAKESLLLIKNSEKVSSLCNDVIGDVCGILSGAAGASITLKIILNNPNDSIKIIIASLISALIAGLTIFGKALGKKYAITNGDKIIIKLGKLLTLFSKKEKIQNNIDKHDSQN